MKVDRWVWAGRSLVYGLLLLGAKTEDHATAALPEGDDWIFEPKWDGFRAVVFRDGDEVFIQSRDEKALNRYFPELLEPLKSQLPRQCVLDGEIVVAKDSGLDFEALQLRIHPIF